MPVISPRSCASCLLVGALVACTAAAPPAAAPLPALPPQVAPAPLPAAPPVAPPRLGLVVEDEVRVPHAPAPAAAPIPLDSPFERLPLPPTATMLVAVEGRDERDVWLLS